MVRSKDYPKIGHKIDNRMTSQSHKSIRVIWPWIDLLTIRVVGGTVRDNHGSMPCEHVSIGGDFAGLCTGHEQPWIDYVVLDSTWLYDDSESIMSHSYLNMDRLWTGYGSLHWVWVVHGQAICKAKSLETWSWTKLYAGHVRPNLVPGHDQLLCPSAKPQTGPVPSCIPVIVHDPYARLCTN